METKKRLIITVPRELHRELKIFAAQKDSSMNKVVNKALAAYDFEAEREK
jgi:predicted HicB family RNase H-like nuclease